MEALKVVPFSEFGINLDERKRDHETEDDRAGTSAPGLSTGRGKRGVTLILLFVRKCLRSLRKALNVSVSIFSIVKFPENFRGWAALFY